MGCIHSLLIGTESLRVPPAGCVYVYGVLSRKMGFSQLSMTDLQNSYAVILSVNKFIAIILCRLNCVSYTTMYNVFTGSTRLIGLVTELREFWKH
jgi:hypothetical protein